MKILKIRFQNINSLKGIHEIDFTAALFQAAGLFAITGPTGIGKSTLLDVITLSLFNRIPRFEAGLSRESIARNGAVLTRNTTECFAETEYESKGRQYRSNWSIKINRNGNFNDYEMFVAELPGGEILTQKKSEVPDKNEEIIGLSYEQFTRSILLSQGAFDRFLKAKKNERGALLEKITGTGIFRAIGIRAFEKNRDIKRQVQDIQGRLEEVQVLPEEALGEIKQQMERLEAELIRVGSLRKEKENLARIKSEIMKARQKQQQWQHNWQQLLQAEEEFQPQSDKLQKYQQLQPFLEPMLQLDNLEEEGKRIKRDQDGINQQLLQRQHVQNNMLEAIQSATAFRGEASTAVDFLEKVYIQYQQVRGRYALSTNQAENAGKSLLKTGQSLAAYSKELQSVQDAEKLLIQFVQRMQGSGFDESKPSEFYEQEGANWQRRRKVLSNMRDNLARIGDWKNNLQILREKSAELNQKLANDQAQYNYTTELLRLKDEELQNQKAQRDLELKKAGLEDHRKELVQGEPCPLCGSTHHPYLQAYDNSVDALKHKVQILEKEVMQLNRTQAALYDAVRLYNHQLEEAARQIAQFEENITARANECHNLQTSSGVPVPGDLEKAESLLIEAETTIDQIARYLKDRVTRDQLMQWKAMYQEKEKHQSEAEKALTELQELYKGRDADADFNKWIKGLANAENEIRLYIQQQQGLEASLSDLRDKYRDMKTRLETALLNAGFSDIQNARLARLNAAEVKSIEAQKQYLQEQRSSVQTSIKECENLIDELNQQDKPEISLEKVQDELSELERLINATGDERGGLRARLEHDAQNRERHALLKNQLMDLEVEARRWNIINELIGDAKGNRFANIAQEITLRQLIAMANARLALLSERYRLFPPDGSTEEMEVADAYQGNLRRSIQTLSGGETFLLSLSMALALSDLASSNVEIGCLFIDEGFGTLDAETLDMAISTLEKLQAEGNKLIGIISHVDALKERISCQVRLYRASQGHSRIEVV
ncbi:MAG: AAA family ATPase [Cyclobacteriaceae bacterium]|nr:AAA family ATPase [Cyclobacteriaceae bacterium]